jgi:hypothetical protein
VLETFIPFSALPAGIDPDSAALNIFIYDSDTEDLTGQTRLGWSTWNGVQGDPYRWGRITLEGYGDPTGTPAASPVAEVVMVDPPIMPLEAAQSLQSRQSIAQSAADGVPLAGLPAVNVDEGLVFTRQPTLASGNLIVNFEALSSGTARFYVVQDDGTLASEGELDVDLGRSEFLAGGVTVTGPANLLVSFVTDDGAVQAFSFPLEG